MQTAPDSSPPIQVLLVEDNPPEVHLIAELLGEMGSAITLHVVHDGEAAIDFLQRTGTFAASPRPDLVLLDLTLPKRDGRDVLAVIKSEPALRAIPTIVVSRSVDPKDINLCYELGANAYLAKPTSLGDFFQAVRALEAFWFRTALLPTAADDGSA